MYRCPTQYTSYLPGVQPNYKTSFFDNSNVEKAVVRFVMNEPNAVLQEQKKVLPKRNPFFTEKNSAIRFRRSVLQDGGAYRLPGLQRIQEL
jgi:hypothetical protein